MTMYWLSKNVLLDRYSCWIWERKETNRKRWNMKKFEDLLTQHARDRFQAQKRPNASNITLTSLYLHISHLSLSFDWCDMIPSLWFDSFSLSHLSLSLSLSLSPTQLQRSPGTFFSFQFFSWNVARSCFLMISHEGNIIFRWLLAL